MPSDVENAVVAPRHGRDGSGKSEAPLWLSFATWRATLLLVLAVLAVRLVYLIWWCPWELVQDEAHYWDWSRHLSLSYYSKGPGVALVIWATTALLGAEEWAIRVPAALASAAAALALARLASDGAGGDERAGFLAAAAFCLVPIFQVEAQVMTVDGPFVACWIVACWIGWHAFAAHRFGGAPWGLWALAGLVMGVGFLFKYTMVMLPVGFVLYAFLRRRRLPWDRRLTAGAALVGAVFVATISPVIIWNAQHGWPTVRHTLGHLGAPGGDRPTQWTRPFAGFSLFELIGAEIGVLGPPIFLLVVLATLWAFQSRWQRPRQWPARLYMLACGLPVIALFVLVSLVSRVEANWPIAGFTTLLVLVAWGLPAARDDWRRRLGQWGHKASVGLPGLRRPHSPWIIAWRWAIGWGIVTAAIVAFPTTAARLPLVGRQVPIERISGAEQMAERVAAAAELVRARTGREPLIVSGSCGRASQLAYYLPGRPTVYDAGGYIGRRPSAYDYFDETDLEDPALHGRPAVMVVWPLERWLQGFRFEHARSLGGDPPIHIGFGYGGPRRE
ncbi:MAG: ArnT family glycosyltransferase [Armatimonadota bacterium]